MSDSHSVQSGEPPTPKRLNVFERYLTLWVALCMVVGVFAGKLLPGAIDALRKLEFGKESQINMPIAVLIWLMIYPMMLKVDFGAIRGVRETAQGADRHAVRQLAGQAVQHGAVRLDLLSSTCSCPGSARNWRSSTSPGLIILAAAPCTAMVFVWCYLTDGDPAYTLVQVAVNDLIMLVAVRADRDVPVSGVATLVVPFKVLIYAVVVFIVIPLAAGVATPGPC